MKLSASAAGDADGVRELAFSDLDHRVIGLHSSGSHDQAPAHPKTRQQDHQSMVSGLEGRPMGAAIPRG